MSDKVQIKEEGTLSRLLTEDQNSTSTILRSELTRLATRVKASRLKIDEKVKLINSLVRSHESLTKAERQVAGLDRKEQSVVNPGVIVIPIKVDGSSWHEHAMTEVTRAKELAVEGGSANVVVDKDNEG